MARINDNSVLDVLCGSEIEGQKLALTSDLDRQLYVKANKVLEALGAKWNRKEKGHIFPDNIDPSEVVEQIIHTGQYVDEKKEYNFFETPQILAKEMVRLADIKSGDIILEPEAGLGAIAREIMACGVPHTLHTIELNANSRFILQENGYNVVANDFMTYELDFKYDVIIANPPFSKQQDIDHVSRMLDIAKRCIVSVMSAGVLFRRNKKTTEFRKKAESVCSEVQYQNLHDGTFKESGTMVRTVLFVAKF